jgi:hypothetical protein
MLTVNTINVLEILIQIKYNYIKIKTHGNVLTNI